jgi:hypothetical protein
MQNLLLSDSPYDGIDMCMGDDLEILFHNPYPMPKPFGIALLRNNAFDTDGIVHQTLMVPKLTSFLANIPCKDDKEVQALRDLLLGPPTIEAARRCTYFHLLCNFFQRCCVHQNAFQRRL